MKKKNIVLPKDIVLHGLYQHEISDIVCGLLKLKDLLEENLQSLSYQRPSSSKTDREREISGRILNIKNLIERLDERQVK